MASSTVAMLLRCEEPRRAKPCGLRDHGDVVVVNLPCPRRPRRARWTRRRPPCRTKVHNDQPPRDQIDHATGRLLETVSELSDDDIRQASLLPGWSRGHLLTHLARSADAMRNLLTWARTGVQTPAYASPQARDADIDAGAGRSRAELAADVADAAAAFGSAALAMPGHAWQVPIRVLSYPEFPAAQLLTRRLVEVELHHTDLGAGYGRANWPATFAALGLPEPMRSQRHERIHNAAQT
jgi:maleylpyruvate isomerase